MADESDRGVQAAIPVARLRALPDLGVAADGIWCNFTAAYLPDLHAVICEWRRQLKADGWVVLVEIDDLFGHQPLSDRVKQLLRAHADEALAAGRFDFFVGRKLKEHLARAGFVLTKELTLTAQEFSLNGPAGSEVVDAWRRRFNRMQLLREFRDPAFEEAQGEQICRLQRMVSYDYPSVR